MTTDIEHTQELETRKPTEAETAYSSANGASRKYATADELLSNAPKDIEERDVENVFGGLTVRVRALTAAQSAHVRQQSFTMNRGGDPDFSWGQMEIQQFELGVVEPRLNHNQVIILHRTAGSSFTRVLQVIDEISGVNKEELRKAQQEFQERGKSEEI